jgi:uncharacterized membrane protein YdjX (TVP38/TMEM64 family)
MRDPAVTAVLSRECSAAEIQDVRDAIRAHRRIVEAAFLLLLLLAMASSDLVYRFVGGLIAAAAVVIRQHPAVGALVFVALAAASAMLVFFSSALIVPVGIEVWGRPVTIALLCTGWLAGGTLTYLVGRYPGRRLWRWLEPRAAAGRYEAMLAAERSFPLVALFQLAVPSEVPGYVLGSLRYPFGRYFLVLAIGEIPYAFGAIYLADSFLHRQYWFVLLLGGAAVAVSAIAALLLRRRSFVPSQTPQTAGA